MFILNMIAALIIRVKGIPAHKKGVPDALHVVDQQACELQAITRVIEAQDQMVENAKMGTTPAAQQRA